MKRSPCPARAPALLGLLLTLQAVSAGAHGGLPETTSLALRPGHPEELLAGATFGAVVSRNGGQGWRWICSEALGQASGSPELLRWHPSGALLAVNGVALLRSVDGGCSWQAHPFFSGRGPADLAWHPAEPRRVWVVTGRSGAANGVFRSEDAGETFAAAGLVRGDLALSGVQVAPSEPRRLYVSGSGAQGPRLLRSEDGGDTWEELTPELPGLEQPYGLKVLRVAEREPERLWARAVSRGRTWLLESRNRGHTLQPVLELEDYLVGLEASGDGNTLWVATLERLYRLRQGAAATVLPRPEGNACVLREGATLYACGDPWVHGWALARSADEGDTWEPLFLLEHLQGPLACPVGTPVHTLCEPRWPALAQLLGREGTGPQPDAGTPPPGPSPRPGGCSATGAEGMAWLAVLALLRRWAAR